MRLSPNRPPQNPLLGKAVVTRLAESLGYENLSREQILGPSQIFDSVLAPLDNARKTMRVIIALLAQTLGVWCAFGCKYAGSWFELRCHISWRGYMARGLLHVEFEDALHHNLFHFFVECSSYGLRASSYWSWAGPLPVAIFQ